jgi:hypothetical protein
MAKALSDLLAEETCLNSLSSTGSNTHSVLAAAQKPKSVFKPCDHCDKTNHRSELCFVKFPEKLTDFRARRAARPLSLCEPHFTVPNIFFVPELSMDLLSVGQITDHSP